MRSLPLGVAIVIGRLVWWAPTIVVCLARLAANHVRFGAEMAVADVLAALGCKRAARRILAYVIVRNRRLMRTKRNQAARRRAQGRKS